MKHICVYAISATIAAFLVTGAANLAQAAMIEVAQESSANAGDFDSNVLGTINPFSTSLTAVNFYNYSNGSYNGDLNGGPAPVSDQTQVFFVDASDGLSFFLVHDARNDGSRGSAQTTWEIVGDSASILAQDELSETTVNPAGTIFTGNHAWGACCTDGYALGDLSGEWSMFGRFNQLPTQITDWVAASAESSNIQLTLSPNQRVRIRPLTEPGPVEVPTPMTVSLLATGLVGFGWSLRRRKSQEYQA